MSQPQTQPTPLLPKTILNINISHLVGFARHWPVTLWMPCLLFKCLEFKTLDVLFSYNFLAIFIADYHCLHSLLIYASCPTLPIISSQRMIGKIKCPT